MKVKKILIVIISIGLLLLLLSTMVNKMLNGGIRSYNALTIEDAIYQENGIYNLNYLCEPVIVDIDNKEICLAVYSTDSDENIYYAFVERKGNKYAYIYQYSFETNEITSESALVAYDIYRGCDLVVGIMPQSNKTILINNRIEVDYKNFDFEDNHYSIWYAVVENGVDGIESICYK